MRVAFIACNYTFMSDGRGAITDESAAAAGQLSTSRQPPAQAAQVTSARHSPRPNWSSPQQLLFGRYMVKHFARLEAEYSIRLYRILRLGRDAGVGTREKRDKDILVALTILSPLQRAKKSLLE